MGDDSAATGGERSVESTHGGDVSAATGGERADRPRVAALIRDPRTDVVVARSRTRGCRPSSTTRRSRAGTCASAATDATRRRSISICISARCATRCTSCPIRPRTTRSCTGSCLQRNHTTYGAHFSIGPDGDIYLVGRVLLEHLDVDRARPHHRCALRARRAVVSAGGPPRLPKGVRSRQIVRVCCLVVSEGASATVRSSTGPRCGRVGSVRGSAGSIRRFLGPAASLRVAHFRRLPSSTMTRVALLGGGKMGAALVGGLLDGGWEADDARDRRDRRRSPQLRSSSSSRRSGSCRVRRGRLPTPTSWSSR